MAEHEDSARAVGAELAEWRHAAGMTGTELARLVKVSQSKISRIENGSLRARPIDVVAIGRAVGAPDAAVRSLLERLTAEPRRFGQWRSAGPAPGMGQLNIGTLESESAEIRGLNVAMVPGLLQTDDYASAVLSDFRKPLGEADPPGSVLAAITARKQRQEVLDDGGKVFLYVLAETVLLHRIATPAVLLAQIERIRIAARRPNVLVRILRSDTELTYPPMHDFVLLDERVAIVETMTTTVLSREKFDLTTYRRIFEYLWSQSTPDIDGVLDSYVRLYAKLAAASTGSPSGPPTAADLLAEPDA